MTFESNVRSQLLSATPKIFYGFGTKKNPLQVHPRADWKGLAPHWKQVHGVGLGKVIQSSQQMGEVDALFTAQAGLPIGVVTADCVPILLAKKDGTAVCAIHAGWRGSIAHITEKVLNQIPSFEGREWSAAIGPSIRACCYEVSRELIDRFKAEFPAHIDDSSRMLDLANLQEVILRRCGISEVENVAECTACTREADGSLKYFSYRRDGSGGRLFSTIGILPEELQKL